MRKVMEFPANVASVAEAGDPDWLLGGTTDGTSLYDWRSGRLIRYWQVKCPFHFRLSSHKSGFIGQDVNGVVSLHPLEGKAAKRLGNDTWHATTYGVLSDDGSLAVTSSMNTGTIRWWSCANAMLLAECSQMSHLAVSRDARRVVGADREQYPMESIELLPDGRLSIAKGPVRQTCGVTFLDDDNSFAVADTNGVTRILEFGTFREIAAYTDDRGRLFGLCYLPKTNRLLIHYEDRTISWNLKTHGLVDEVPEVRHPSCFAVINGGTRLAVSSRQWIRVFEV